uniref:HTH cro/C1-type domain-containing protein n=1 Tax=uncultured Candidatus Melainabacteria bacterium TaxID=2682970 RepID=A0A650EJ30_9BACT|nr:hypothetical protein Melaina855_0870 [uncultured Candidatus Melainabacteria bacterium]
MEKDKSRHYKSYIKLGNNIRNLRNDKKLSQEELAFQISSARNYIGCIERAEKVPSLATVLDIADALGCHVSDLFKNI